MHAFAVGAAQVCGCSDDGEPSGTAGRPVLNALKGARLTDCMITVTRWFGGTLLGTGGLARAYADAAKSVIAAAKVRECVPLLRFAAQVPYPLIKSFLRLAKATGAQVGPMRFDSSFPVIEGLIPEEEAKGFAEAAAELSGGGINLELRA